MSTTGQTLPRTSDSLLRPSGRPAQEVALIGDSPAMQRMRAQIDCAAQHIRVAALEGASGTGKQTAARVLHERAGGTAFLRFDAREWVQLHTREDELPAGATLYLDRVELLDAEGQAQLHQLLRQMHENPSAELRVLVSSHESLRQLATHRQMLPDLVYRLTAVRFHLPLLQERIEDLPQLCDYWVSRFSARYGFGLHGVTPAALALLARHPWPGNLRELVCVLESACLEATSEWIVPENLSLPPVLPPTGMQFRDAPGNWQGIPPENVEDLTLDTHVRQHVSRVLSITHGNKLRAATLLGISRSTLYRMLAGGGLALS